jgi:PAS domain S-box-containing protein
MHNDNKKIPSDNQLRKKAEAQLANEKCVLPPSFCSQYAQKLINEIRVHQVELEMQNDELLRAQTDLEKATAKYSDLFDFSPVGYISLNREGLIREANLTAASLLGIERNQLIGLPFLVHVAPADRNLLYSHCETVFKTGGRDVCELRLKKKGGEEFCAHLESIVVGDARGEAFCRAAIMDVSDRKRTEEVLLKEHEILQAHARQCEEVNIALKVLLDQREAEKRKMAEDTRSNIRQFILPYLDKLEVRLPDPENKALMDIVKTNLDLIVSQDNTTKFSLSGNLTLMEMRVADFVRSGRSCKDIASLMNISMNTVSFHRKNIRRKFGIKKKKVNLRSCL